MAKVRPVPEGFHTVTPHLVLKDTKKALEWYQKALGAEVVMNMPGPGGGTMHAEFRVGDSIIMAADEWPGMELKAPQTLKGSTVCLMLYVENCDATFQRATQAGAKVVMPPMDMFWGDRYSKFQDPFGHEWAVATHIEDVSPEECMRRQGEWMKQMAQQGGGKAGGCGDPSHKH